MNDLTRSVLDIWLKFGTAFIVYRIGMFYATKQSGDLFDDTFLQILLFTLIGFSLYYIIVKPLITIEHPLMRDLTQDFLFFGGGILVAQLLYGYVNNVEYSTRETEAIGYLLVSLAIYRIAVYPFVPNKFGDNQPAVDDVIKFGSILIVYQIVSTGDIACLTNQAWLMSLGFAILGFLVYHYGTKQLMNMRQNNRITN